MEAMPTDVQAYLTQATKDLIASQGASFASPVEFQEWAFQNMPEIARLAKDLQQKMVYEKLLGKPEVLAAAGKVLAAQVWGEVRRSEINEQVSRAVYEVLA
jgi:hypothetical protein